MEKNNKTGEELTEKMHSEFVIDAETQIKHQVYCVLGCVQDGADLAEMIELYAVTREQVDRHIDEFNSLQEDGQQITL